MTDREWLVDVADRVPDATLFRPVSHMERTRAELERERPEDADREPPTEGDA